MRLRDNQRSRPDWVVTVIAVLSLPLFFYGLGSTYLWQDEAQTALLGRSVLAHGAPMVGKGAESLSAVRGRDEGVGGLYFQTSWMQAYLAAASFKLFGESSWAARLPFAFAGWLCIPLVAWLIRGAGSGVGAARMAALLTALNVPFIIFARQARYYPLAAAITLLATGAYAALSDRISKKDPHTALASVFFGTAASLLVLSFDVTAIGVLGALGLHWLWTTRAGSDRWSRAFWIPFVCSCVLLSAWIGLSFTAASRQEQAGAGTIFRRLRHGMFYYLGQINGHIVPLPGLLSLAILWRRTIGTMTVDQVLKNRQSAILLAAVALGGIGGASLPPDRFFRYAVSVLPLVIGLLAIGLSTVWSLGRSGKALVAAALVALLTSNILLVWSHSALSGVARASGVVTVRDRTITPRVPLRLLMEEFRDPPRGPIAAMVRYLHEHARDDDVLVTAYGDLPLKFHTRLRIYGGETGQLPPADLKADWIWSRKLWVYGQVRPSVEWIQRELARGGYRSIELPATDRRWENREDPAEHIFTNPGPGGPHVVLYRLSSGVE